MPVNALLGIIFSCCSVLYATSPKNNFTFRFIFSGGTLMSIIELFENILVGAGACRLCIELLNEEQRQVMFGHRGVQFPSSLFFVIILYLAIS